MGAMPPCPLQENGINELLVVSADRFGKLIGAGGVAAAGDSLQLGGDFFSLAAGGQPSHALGVALAAVVDAAEGNDAVLDLQINGGGAGALALVIKH